MASSHADHRDPRRRRASTVRAKLPAVHPGAVQPDRVHDRQGRADRRDRHPRHRLADPPVRPRPDPAPSARAVLRHHRLSGMGDGRRRRPDADEPLRRARCGSSRRRTRRRGSGSSGAMGLSFSAIVDNVQQKFTLFNPAGIPLRATLTVSFAEYKTLEEQLKELNLQSADHTRSGGRATRRHARAHRLRGVRRPAAVAPDRRRATRESATRPAPARPATELAIPAMDVPARTPGGGGDERSAAIPIYQGRTSTSRPSRCGWTGGRRPRTSSATSCRSPTRTASGDRQLRDRDQQLGRRAARVQVQRPTRCSTRARRRAPHGLPRPRRAAPDDHGRDHLAAAVVPGRRAADARRQRTQRPAPLPHASRSRTPTSTRPTAEIAEEIGARG